MSTIEIYKDRNDNYYVQVGNYKVRIADDTRHDGTTIGDFFLVIKLNLSDLDNSADHIEFAIYLTGHDRATIEQMYRDWKR